MRPQFGAPRAHEGQGLSQCERVEDTSVQV